MALLSIDSSTNTLVSSLYARKGEKLASESWSWLHSSMMTSKLKNKLAYMNSSVTLGILIIINRRCAPIADIINNG